MPFRSAVIGATTPPHRATCDARRLIAYSAGLGLTDPCYLDTTRPEGVTAHPLFPVSVEWAVLTASRSEVDYGLSRSEALRGVHASHHLVRHRPIRQGGDVVVTATVVGVEATPPGARVTHRLDAVEADGGRPTWTTWYVTIYRGVGVEGPDFPPTDLPRRPSPYDTEPIDHREVAIPATAAHVYTECARIWNPIHTDLAVAHAAGLPSTVLHGTATLAHGVTSTLEMLGRNADTVTRLGGSFRAIVPMPSTLRVELLSLADAAGARLAQFQVRVDGRDVAVRHGYIEVAS